LAVSPSMVYQVFEGHSAIARRGERAEEFTTKDPLADLAKLFPPRTYHRDPNLPAFTGGLVGYAGYDTIRYYESEKLTKPPKDDRHIPDLLFGLYHELVIFDHVDKTIKVVANAGVQGPGVRSQGEAAYHDA